MYKRQNLYYDKNTDELYAFIMYSELAYPEKMDMSDKDIHCKVYKIDKDFNLTEIPMPSEMVTSIQLTKDYIYYTVYDPIPVSYTHLDVYKRQNHGSLISGSALCGGRAYALLESFFRKYVAACGFTDSEQYEIMNSLALDAIKKDRHLHVCTTFCGIRSDHTIRGSVTGIGEENLGPGELIAGVLYGMAEELHGMFAEMPKDGIRQLVVSGNAVRKNPALRRVLERVFGMKILVPVHQEEAAYGSFRRTYIRRNYICLLYTSFPS